MVVSVSSSRDERRVDHYEGLLVHLVHARDAAIASHLTGTITAIERAIIMVVRECQTEPPIKWLKVVEV